MLIASGITLGLAVVALVLRMIVKKFIVHSTSWEDHFASAALLLAIGRTVIFILREYRGTALASCCGTAADDGRDSGEVPPVRATRVGL